jgi:hypothetical protein
MGTSTAKALRESRILFRPFYSAASIDDAAAMDLLVKAYISATLGILLPRRFMDPEARMRVERDCDRSEREFLHARDEVRACRTFQSLTAEDQKRVASLFELTMPSE